MPIDANVLELVAGRDRGVLATLKQDGRPQLSNVLYLWRPWEQTVWISTTADRAKARNLRRDPRASLHLSGEHFWTYVVAEGDATVSGPTTTPGDVPGRELLDVHTFFYGRQDEDAFFHEMIDKQRLVVKLHIAHTYSLVLAQPPNDATTRTVRRSDDTEP